MLVKKDFSKSGVKLIKQILECTREKRKNQLSELQKNQKIKELSQQLYVLREQKSKLDKEAEGYTEKRDKLNEQSKKMQAEILDLKTKRDSLNQEVKKLKTQREKAKLEIQRKIEEIKKLTEEIQVLSKRKPPRTRQFLEKEIESIEWKIQTTSLDLKEEKELVEKVKQLESQLYIHRKIEELKQKRLELKAQIRTIQINNESYHKQLTSKAQKSMEIHKEMIGKIEKSKKVRTDADKYHKLLLEVREKAKSLREEILRISTQVKQLKEDIKVKEIQRKEKSEKSLRETLQKQVKEKLEKGEKLTWEEFQLLAEDETQN